MRRNSDFSDEEAVVLLKTLLDMKKGNETQCFCETSLWSAPPHGNVTGNGNRFHVLEWSGYFERDVLKGQILEDWLEFMII